MLTDARATNRMSHQKSFVEKFQYGYNIVDHRDYRDPQTYMCASDQSWHTYKPTHLHIEARARAPRTGNVT